MSFWDNLDSWSILLSLGCSWNKPSLKLVQSALIFLALWLAPQFGTQWAMLKWEVGRSSESPFSVLKGQTEAQIPDSWRPSSSPGSQDYSCLISPPLYLFVFLFSVLDSSEDKAWGTHRISMSPMGTGLYPTFSACPATTPSLRTITAFQGVREDLPRRRNESWSTAAGSTIDTWGVWRASQSAGCEGQKWGWRPSSEVPENERKLSSGGPWAEGKEAWMGGREGGRGRDNAVQRGRAQNTLGIWVEETTSLVPREPFLNLTWKISLLFFLVGQRTQTLVLL